MSPIEFQFKTIFNSYTFNNCNLVYSKQDQCFYTLGSLYSLNQGDYETNSKDITKRVQDFIEQNQDLLDRKLLTQLQGHLSTRIRKIEGRTTGLLAFFYFIFNPHRKDSFQQRKAFMVNLQITIATALTQIDTKSAEDQEDLDDDFMQLIEPTTPETKQGRFVDQKKVLVKSVDYSPSKLKINNTPRKKLGDELTTPHKENESQTSAQQNHHLLKNPLRPTPGKKKPNMPPPPIPGLSQLKQFPNEPQPLGFDAINYKTLPKEVVLKQVAEIEEYVQKSKPVLDALQQTVEQYKSQQNSMKENAGHLTEANNQLQQCKANLQLLEKGEEDEKIVFLLFKHTKGYTQVPFYPDNLIQQIFDRYQALVQEASQKKQPFLDEIISKMESLEQKKDELKNSKVATKQEDLKLQIQQIQESIYDLNKQAEEIGSISSPFDKGWSFLKMSIAIEQFNLLIEQLEQRIIVLEAKQTQLKQECTTLEEKCLQEHDISLEKLESTVEEKFKKLMTWQRHQHARQQFLKQKSTGKVHTPTKDSPKKIGIIDEFPELLPMKDLPQHLLILLRRASLGGESPGDILEEFDSRLHGQLYSTNDD